MLQIGPETNVPDKHAIIAAKEGAPRSYITMLAWRLYYFMVAISLLFANVDSVKNLLTYLGPVIFISIISIVWNLIWIRFDYSLLGSRKRGSLPQNGNIVESSGMEGGQKFPIITYSLYKKGFEITILMIGSIYIDFDEV